MAITVLRFDPPWGTEDEYGDPVHAPDAEPDSTHEIPGAIAPATSSDVSELGRFGVVIGLELYCTDVDADLVRTDVIEYRGERWEIEGEVGEWRSPFGDLAQGLSCALKRGQG